MRSINKIRSYFLEDELEIKLYKNKVNIVNYDSIGHFDSNKVMVYCDDVIIIVAGQNLVVSRLVTDEILIVGNIKNVELR